MATIPTEHNLRLLERYKIRVKQAREARVADLKVLAEQITKMPGITIEANANEEGHLYGSVGPAEISKGLKAKGLMIDAEMVHHEGAIKETGLYAIKLNLGYEIETEVKVAVIKSQGK
jgi:large subunit ribosomal protein L9